MPIGLALKNHFPPFILIPFQLSFSLPACDRTHHSIAASNTAGRSFARTFKDGHSETRVEIPFYQGRRLQ